MAGSLTNALGATVTFARIKAIVIASAATNGGNIEIGGAASAQFSSMFGDVSDKLIVNPGGFVVLATPGATGYAVTATSADLLKIANADSGASASYDIILIGATS